MSMGRRKEQAPEDVYPPEPACALAHLGPDIPWRSCVPAEPASVSPDNRTVARRSARVSREEPTNNLRSASAFDHGSLRLLGHLFSHLCARKECSAEFRGAGSIAWGKISYRANSTLVYRQDVSGKRLELSKRSPAQPHRLVTQRRHPHPIPHAGVRTTLLRYIRKSDYPTCGNRTTSSSKNMHLTKEEEVRDTNGTVVIVTFSGAVFMQFLP